MSGRSVAAVTALMLMLTLGGSHASAAIRTVTIRVAGMT